jgi:hypothetical protein
VNEKKGHVQLYFEIEIFKINFIYKKNADLVQSYTKKISKIPIGLEPTFYSLAADMLQY